MYINVSVNICLCWLCLSTFEPLLLCLAKLCCLLYSAQDHHYTMSFILCGFGYFVFPALFISRSVRQALKYGRFPLFYSLPVLVECDFQTFLFFPPSKSVESLKRIRCRRKNFTTVILIESFFMNRKNFSWVSNETERFHNTLLTIMS